ncbi:Aste57867_17509 [Aphanomyces stellatus]|uniref:Aste57867_17509 protein n=1 Tax=Aphanomyces stellatus TaxID=120398 RepID=A0A485LBJ4_9STRA|nr:hypothetical protein As57867_017449 [Aphanomyces stellatus]VFT94262.1 Aste57867_17509 [Aphanomyces stellatus]
MLSAPPSSNMGPDGAKEVRVWTTPTFFSPRYLAPRAFVQNLSLSPPVTAWRHVSDRGDLGGLDVYSQPEHQLASVGDVCNDAPMNHLAAAAGADGNDGPPPPSALPTDAQSSIRHRRKMNKRRLRAEQRDRMERLARDLEALTGEILALEHQLFAVEQTVEGTTLTMPRLASPPPPSSVSSLAALMSPSAAPLPSTSSGTTAAHVLRHYFAAFRHGYTSSLRDTLVQIVHPDVRFMGLVGIRHLEAHWERCCDVYASFEMELQSTRPVDPRQWIATARLLLQMTPRTIESLYPHLVDMPDVAAALVARPLELHMQCHVWLDRHFKITRLEYAIGWAPALLALVADAEVVAAVMAKPPSSTSSSSSLAGGRRRS